VLIWIHSDKNIKGRAEQDFSLQKHKGGFRGQFQLIFISFELDVTFFDFGFHD